MTLLIGTVSNKHTVLTSDRRCTVEEHGVVSRVIIETVGWFMFAAAMLGAAWGWESDGYGRLRELALRLVGKWK